jgi:hypothetical protein
MCAGIGDVRDFLIFFPNLPTSSFTRAVSPSRGARNARKASFHSSGMVWRYRSASERFSRNCAKSRISEFTL